MTTFTKLGAEIWRDYETDGVPSSGAHKPVKGDVRQWSEELESFASVSLTNGRLAKTANYTVVNGDKGQTIALGGSTYFTLTLNAASGYDSNFQIRIVNEDSSRAKFISASGLTGFYLWPLQSVELYAQNNSWKVFGRTRWNIPNSVTFNTDFTNGSDVWGTSDGLGTVASAFKSVNHALGVVQSQIDFHSSTDNGDTGENTVTILMASGSTDTNGIHFSGHGPVGAHGGAALNIDLNGGTLDSASGTIQVYFGAVLRFRNGVIQSSTAGDALLVTWGAKVYLLDGITFGSISSGASHIDVQRFGQIEFANNYTISGGVAGSYHINCINGSVAADTITVTVSANISFQNTVRCSNGGNCALSAVTWSLGGHTVTATNKYNALTNGIIEGASSVPGSGAGTTASGGQAV